MANLKATTITGDLTTTGTINSINIGRISNYASSLYITPGSTPTLGINATAIGSGTSASGGEALSIGLSASAGAAYAIAIGRSASASGTKGIAIGHSATATTGTTINVTSPTGSGNYLSLGVAGEEWAFRSSAFSSWDTGSDRRDKTDFIDIPSEKSLELVLNLKPKSYRINPRYHYDDESLDENGNTIKVFNEEEYIAGTRKKNRFHSGFIAQEAEEAVISVLGGTDKTSIVSKNTVDDPLAIREKYTMIYEEIIPYLTGAIQELNKKILFLEDEIKKIKGE